MHQNTHVICFIYVLWSFFKEEEKLYTYRQEKQGELVFLGSICSLAHKMFFANVKKHMKKF